MTWPFENDTSAITKKLAKKSLQSEKRRNLMVVIAVALAAFLICFTGIVSTSLTQMQRNQVVDTYEAVWLGVEENDIETLKGLPEFERVGGYYMLGEELSEQGYHASYVTNIEPGLLVSSDSAFKITRTVAVPPYQEWTSALTSTSFAASPTSLVALRDIPVSSVENEALK